MKIATPKHRVIPDAALDNSVIRGTLTAPSGDRWQFHGRLDHAPNNILAASASVPSAGRGSRSAGERSNQVS